MERLDKLNEELNKLNALSKQVEVFASSQIKMTYYNCMKSFGHKTFCKCLAHNLAMGLFFMDYIAITTRSKNDLGYDSLSKEKKSLVDQALRTRKKCVAELTPKIKADVSADTAEQILERLRKRK